MLFIRRKQMAFSLLVIYPVVVYLIVCIAPYIKGSLPETIENISSQNITYIPTEFNSHTLKVIMTSTVLYFMISVMIISSMRNTRVDEEHGSAKFGSILNLVWKYTSKIKRANIKLSSHVGMNINVRKHDKNLNLLLIGGSGTGKSRGFIIPNIISAQCSFVSADPKGEILAKTGKLLKHKGFDIRVLDLKNHNKSFGYNPFKYFKKDNDILIFVNNMWESMSDKRAQKGEEVWPELAKAMLLSFMLYLYHFAPPEEQNFDMVMKMYKEVKASEGIKEEKTVVDLMFEEIDHEDVAYGYYKTWSNAKGKTLASILATFAAKMTVFNLESLINLTYYDEMDLLDFADKDKKIALFCITPDDDSSFNFLAATLYRQLMSLLYDFADNVLHGPLPNLVMFFLDEFANVALPDNFNQIMSTARSRNMGFSIILQNKEQIETLYEKWWKTITGNCDTKIFLGSSDPDTCKYFTEILDKETVIYYTREPNQKGIFSGKRETKVERDLMKPGELASFDNAKEIDYKIDLKRCRNYKEIADGRRFEENLYEWGETYESDGEVNVLSEYNGIVTPLPKSDGVLLDEHDLEKLFG